MVTTGYRWRTLMGSVVRRVPLSLTDPANRHRKLPYSRAAAFTGVRRPLPEANENCWIRPENIDWHCP
jgi:hypothetical protein